jgi:GTP-binding protein
MDSGQLARTSNTPGRTQELNFFDCDAAGFTLVDMPGYGYAKAKDNQVEHWQKTSFQYLTTRPNLKRVFLLIDPVKGLKDGDREMINIFNALAVSFQVVLTKIDKLNRPELSTFITKLKDELSKSVACYPEVISTSSSKGYGIDELQNQIVSILQRL